MSAPWLVLFDIDGTLVQTGHAGIRGMNAAFERLYGVSDALGGIPIAGRTDRAIVSDALRVLGREASADEILELRTAYIEDLGREILRPVAAPRGVLPGVDALLDALAARPGHHVGLLTGNFEQGAAIKLTHFDLWRRFAFGAFGDEHDDRRALLPLAVDRAQRAGWPVSPPDRVIVIGDTPLDVDCAQAHGARAVAVATGPYDRETLQSTGADLVVENLTDVAGLIDWLK